MDLLNQIHTTGSGECNFDAKECNFEDMGWSFLHRGLRQACHHWRQGGASSSSRGCEGWKGRVQGEGEGGSGAYAAVALQLHWMQ